MSTVPESNRTRFRSFFCTNTGCMLKCEKTNLKIVYTLHQCRHKTNSRRRIHSVSPLKGHQSTTSLEHHSITPCTLFNIAVFPQQESNAVRTSPKDWPQRDMLVFSAKQKSPEKLKHGLGSENHGFS